MGTEAKGLRATPGSAVEDAFDIALQRFSREGEVENKERLPLRSRELGRCCQDKVPALLRNVEEAFGDTPASFVSGLGPVGLFSMDAGVSSRNEVGVL